MKIILLLLLLIPTLSFTQARLGSSRDEIFKEFNTGEYQITTKYSISGDSYLMVITKRAIIAYTFNDDNICNNTNIIPLTAGQLNWYVELYNRQYVILSPTKWQAYLEGGICLIQLVYMDNGTEVFIWSN